MITNINKFIKELEDIYETYDIYRCIIIINNIEDKNKLINKLKKYNHNPLYISASTDNIDLNYRLYIILNKNINIIYNNINIKNYNFLAFLNNNIINYFLNI